MIGLVMAVGMLAAGDYTYKATRDGSDVGTSTISVRANGSSTDIEERAVTTLTGEPSSGTASLSLDANLAPVSYRANGKVGDDAVSDAVTISGSNASVLTPNGAKKVVQLGSAAHFVVVDFGTLAGLMPLAAQAKAWGSAGLLAIVPAFGQGVPVAVTPTNSPRPAGVPAKDAAVSFDGAMPLVIWYDADTLIPDYLALPAQGISIVRQ
jgi:hypothetical protein